MSAGGRQPKAVVVAAALGAGAFAVLSLAQATSSSAQSMGSVQSRGVIILRPTATPSPTPTATVAPAPVVRPSPAPAPVRPVAPLPAPLPIVKTCPRPFAQPDLRLPGLSGSAGFDRMLQRRLAGRHGSVVIDIPQPFAVGAAPPPPLAAWLTEVKSSGGIVSVDEYCNESRGLFSFLRRMFNGKAASPYAAADTYDAVLHVNGLDQVVTQVEFRPRVPRR